MELDPIGLVCAAVVVAASGGAVGYQVGRRSIKAAHTEELGPAVLKEDVAKMCFAHLACRNRGIVYAASGPRLCEKAKAKFAAKHGRQVVEHEGALYWRIGVAR